MQPTTRLLLLALLSTAHRTPLPLPLPPNTFNFPLFGGDNPSSLTATLIPFFPLPVSRLGGDSSFIQPLPSHQQLSLARLVFLLSSSLRFPPHLSDSTPHLHPLKSHSFLKLAAIFPPPPRFANTHFTTTTPLLKTHTHTHTHTHAQVLVLRSFPSLHLRRFPPCALADICATQHSLGSSPSPPCFPSRTHPQHPTCSRMPWVISYRQTASSLKTFMRLCSTSTMSSRTR